MFAIAGDGYVGVGGREFKKEEEGGGRDFGVEGWLKNGVQVS